MPCNMYFLLKQLYGKMALGDYDLNKYGKPPVYGAAFEYSG